MDTAALLKTRGDPVLRSWVWLCLSDLGLRAMPLELRTPPRPAELYKAPRSDTQVSTKISVDETCTHLAVIIWGVHTGVDHIEQWIDQSFAGSHLLSGLFPSRAQVPEGWNDKGTRCTQGQTDNYLFDSLQKVFMQLIGNCLATLSD